MLSAFFLAALAAPSAAAPPPPPSQQRCNPGLTFVGKRSGKTGARKLGELPPADLYLTVHRHMGGCPIPAIVRTRGGD